MKVTLKMILHYIYICHFKIYYFDWTYSFDFLIQHKSETHIKNAKQTVETNVLYIL